MLDVAGKDVENFGDLLRDYVHVREVNAANNKLRDVSEVTFLPYLELLNATHN